MKQAWGAQENIEGWGQKERLNTATGKSGTAAEDPFLPVNTERIKTGDEIDLTQFRQSTNHDWSSPQNQSGCRKSPPATQAVGPFSQTGKGQSRQKQGPQTQVCHLYFLFPISAGGISHAG